MSRLCWFFVLVALVVLASSNARPHECERRERSLADLDLAEDALNKAKQFYPNFEKENSDSSECSKKDKSLGFIDVALDLVSNAKKNIPICHHYPTEEPFSTTEDPGTSTEESVSTTEDPGTTTEESFYTTEDPGTTTEESVSTAEDPGTTTEEPFSTTEEPVTTDSFRPMDCQDLQAAGHVTSGVYTVWPQGEKSAVRVRCDMDTDGGSWTVIQRRGNFFVQENFDRNWHDYKRGFGSLERDFWLGNDNIFALTNQGSYSLRMDMTSADGDSAYALYREFWIEDESANYTLHLDGYSGGIGDDMTSFSGMQFSTRDRKNNVVYSVDCAEWMEGGWWYHSCALCNPNGLYKPGVRDESSMHYYEFRRRVGLSSFEIKIKRL